MQKSTSRISVVVHTIKMHKEKHTTIKIELAQRLKLLLYSSIKQKYKKQPNIHTFTETEKRPFVLLELLELFLYSLPLSLVASLLHPHLSKCHL